ncbi:hypothetical protein SteCoe_2137 [Stentor coeruleus]|uniref:Uncharacterized protein n=1 Tax=Stentor coeruleus TaxID=5963 RepID=A0A1R2D077_9CILI|nr:hypothetical protein SteCoe_2137 [Stentor coeruleus]
MFTLTREQSNFAQIKELSKHLKTYKKSSTLPIEKKPAIEPILRNFESRIDSTAYYLISKIELTQHDTEKSINSLEMGKSTYCLISSKLTKKLSLQSSKVALELNKLSKSTEDYEENIETYLDDELYSLKLDLKKQSKEREKDYKLSHNRLNEGISVIAQIVEGEQKDRQRKTDDIIENISKGFEDFNIALIKLKEERLSRNTFLWKMFEEMQNHLEEEALLEQQKRLQTEDALFKLFEETCNKVEFNRKNTHK